MEQTLSLSELDELRNGVVNVIRQLELKKHQIRSHDRNKLINHLNYTLETLDNMVNIKKVEMSDPYNGWSAKPGTNYMIDPRATKRTVVYNSDGTTRIIDNSKMDNTGEEWERQFDQSQLINPPCYMMPPQNLSSIQRIKNASVENRVSSLTGPYAHSRSMWAGKN